MNTSLADVSLGQLVVERPGRACVLERHGLDYCCGGQMSLAEACRKHGLDIVAVTDELSVNDADRPGLEDVDWLAVPLSALIDEILRQHHDRLRRELPRLLELSNCVLAAHRTQHPELQQLDGILHQLRDHLATHMLKEERILFPWIKQLEREQSLSRHDCGSVGNPIVVMEHEHAEAAEAIQQMRSLTSGYSPPADACAKYRALLDGLADLERDLHLHVHKENNILFPRTRALEAQLRERSGL